MLKAIGYLILAWFVFRLLDRLFSKPRQSRGPQRPRSTARTGEQQIIINYDPRSTKSAVSEDTGEVVDFEEVKED